MAQTQSSYQPTLGEIKSFAFGFAPKNWARCEGQSLSANQNHALFSLIGFTYGGSGDTFKLPDLRGRVLLHTGNGYDVAKGGGEETHVLTLREMAAHKHRAMASSKASDEPTPKHNYWPREKPYRTDTNTKLNESAIGKTGGDKPHDNMAPFLSVNYCIALVGIFPTHTVSEDYVGTIKTFPYLKPFDNPWAVCDGRELSISQYRGLFSVIGNHYGGNGQTTFRLPDLRGKAALGQGKGEGLSRYQVGDTGGAAQVTLTEDQLPPHQHAPNGKDGGNTPNANDLMVWANGSNNGFATEKGTGPLLHPGALDVAGESASHNNMMPYQVGMYIIAIDGELPPRG
jgi:microcystin-dependent protein